MNESTKRTFKIAGMTCGHCKVAVEEAIMRLAEVHDVSVDLNAGKALVVGGPADSMIVAAVEEAGYEAHAATIVS